LIYLGVWLASCLGLLALTVAADPWSGWLWVIGNGLGMGLGGIGTASRSLVGRFTPTDRTAEFFGLWGMVYKLAGAIGVLSFGATREVLGKPGSMVLLSAFFVVGGLIMLSVSEVRGLRAAKRNDRDTLHRDTPRNAKPEVPSFSPGPGNLG
jgi:UMF1 family MFS transporter